jgi:hypothetical protein
MNPAMPEFRVGAGSLSKFIGKGQDRGSIQALPEFMAASGIHPRDFDVTGILLLDCGLNLSNEVAVGGIRRTSEIGSLRGIRRLRFEPAIPWIVRIMDWTVAEIQTS